MSYPWEREEARDAKAEQWSWAHPLDCRCRACVADEATGEVTISMT